MRPKVPISCRAHADRPAGLAPAGDHRRRRAGSPSAARAGTSGSASLVDDPRFARQSDRRRYRRILRTSKTVTMAVEPAQIITGRVTYADTGKPAPHAARRDCDPTATAARPGPATSRPTPRGGSAPIPGRPIAISVTVFAPERAALSERLAEVSTGPRGRSSSPLDLALPRGVLIRGKVTEEGSGKPVAGARIGYISNPDRDPARRAPGTAARRPPADGSFQLGVVPGPGYLIVLGPSDDYVLQRDRPAHGPDGPAGRPPAVRPRLHRARPETGQREPGRHVALRPGADREGPGRRAGRPAGPGCLVISRVILQPTWIAWLFWTVALPRHRARRPLRGARPGRRRRGPRLLPRARHKLGRPRCFSGKSAAGGPVTVRLEPCGAARARLVDPAGKPVARSRDTYRSHMTMMVVTPGRSSGRATTRPTWIAWRPIRTSSPGSTRSTTRKGLVSDAQGRARPPGADPGRDVSHLRRHDGDGGRTPRLRKEFTVKPGETLDLGDILIEKPRPDGA